jgi:hypothetical protein
MLGKTSRTQTASPRRGQGRGAQKDVKNEGRSDYVYENTDDGDKMVSEKQGILQENAPIEA